jgi:flagellar biosynthetic protein FlhB
MADEQGDKTEEPSAKRLGENRASGNVLQSRDVTHFFMIGAGTLVVFALGPTLMSRVMTVARVFFERPHLMPIDSENLATVSSELLLALAFALLVPMAVLIFAAVASSVLQYGFLFSSKKLFEFDLNKLNPISGVKRLFSLRQVIELVKGIIKIGLIAVVGFALISPGLTHIDTFVSADITDSLAELARLSKRFLIGVLVMLLALGGFDYIYQRWDF